jgi:hypothetical protein
VPPELTIPQWAKTAAARVRRQQVGDPIVPLSAAACGAAGGYYFVNEPLWVVRHVETLEMRGVPGYGRRRLTVDLALPEERAAAVHRDGDDSLYCIPIARLSKEAPVAFIDLLDEAGHSIPLLTRDENARISSLALQAAVRRVCGMSDDEDLPEQVTLGVEALDLPRPIPDYFAVIFREATTDLASERSKEVPDRLFRVTNQLVENSYLWTALKGRPGDRRVIKISYTIEIRLPSFPARRAKLITPTLAGVELPTTALDGGIDVTQSVRSLRARLAARIGWDSIDLLVPDPVVQDPTSYHLQVSAPAGLLVDRIEFSPSVGDPQIDPKSFYVQGEHLYLPWARLDRAVPLSISMRVERAGFLNLSMLSAAIICATLWLYQASSHAIENSGDKGTSAAAVLLVIPALLVLFATRPSDEHPLASVLLSGIRVAMLLIGLTTAAAAAAIAGVRPAGSLASSMIVYAVVESSLAGVVGIAWIGSWTPLRRMAERVRRWWCSAPAGSPGQFIKPAATAAAVFAIDFAAHARLLRAHRHPTRTAAVLLFFALIGLYGAVRHLRRGDQPRRVPNGVRVLAAASVAVALASAEPGGPHALAVNRDGIWQACRWIALGLTMWALFSWIALWLAPVDTGLARAPVAPEPLGDARQIAAAGAQHGERPSEAPQPDPAGADPKGIAEDRTADTEGDDAP